MLTIVLLSATGFVFAKKKNKARAIFTVYKTRGNYVDNVPVTLAEDRKTIGSFPDPTDMKSSSKPEQLHKGYLIDNMGINAKTAFLKISYADYIKLQQAPSIEDLQKSILVTDPFTIICDCGVRIPYKDPKAQLNKMIDNGTLFKKCKIIYQAQR